MLVMNVCSDPALAKVLSIVKNLLTTVQIIVPIVLIISGSINFGKMVISPEDSRGDKMKNVINSFLSAVIVFLIPFVINLAMNVISVTGEVGIVDGGNTTTFDISSCWNSAANKADAMDSANDTTNSTIASDAKKKLTKLP